MSNVPYAFVPVAVPPATSFVWQPGGTAGPNVFTSWATLYAAIQAAGESVYTVLVDTTLGAATVPAGSYNLGSGVFKAIAAVLTIVTFETGATFVANNFTLDGVQCESSNASSPVWTVSAGLNVLTLQSGAELGGSPTFPFVQVAGGTLFGVVSTGSTLQAQAVGVSPGGTANVLVFTDSLLLNDSLVATSGGSATLRYDSSVKIAASAAGAGWTVVQLSIASSTAYTPAVLANWSGTAPTSVANALDRIAAKITPIP